MSWAMQQEVGKSSTKFLLVALADCVNQESGEMVCWPSHAHLSKVTGQDAKTVDAGLKRLRELGFIVDTGERKGVTGRVVSYRLNTPEIGVINTSKNGAVEGEGNTPVFPMQSPQISVPIPPNFPINTPKNGGRNQEGTRKEPGRNQEVDARLRVLPPSLVSDYLKVRKAKRAGEFTETAIDGMEREAGKVGLSLEEAMRFCCEAGWQGFNANWWRDRNKSALSAGSSGGSARAARMAEAVPSLAGRKGNWNVIDMEATNVVAGILG